MVTTTIPLKYETRLRLQKCGIKGNTYDQIINALIDAFGGPDKFRLLHPIKEEETK